MCGAVRKLASAIALLIFVAALWVAWPILRAFPHPIRVPFGRFAASTFLLVMARATLRWKHAA
jgi:hypothetical protein